NSTGDGVFRMLNLRPGRYRLTGTLVGYLPLFRDGIELRAGEVFVIEQTLLLEAGAPGPLSLPVPELPSVYRNIPLGPIPLAGVSVAAAPLELPPAQKVF